MDETRSLLHSNNTIDISKAPGNFNCKKVEFFYSMVEGEEEGLGRPPILL
jgi:hypothetical protein